MTYKVNPKMHGSGMLAAIPQTGQCPNNCPDCFFQDGRSYLEPLDENLPNMPPLEDCQSRVVRVNDGNDSNVKRDEVIAATAQYPMKFYNTAISKLDFPGPVVLTVNPGKLTGKRFYRLGFIPDNLMFIRIRTNTWNIEDVVDPAVEYYTRRAVPVVLTFMAYFTQPIPPDRSSDYITRKRTLNSYCAITTAAWERVMDRYKHNERVYSCGKIEGEKGSTSCRLCGNCLREYFSTIIRIGYVVKSMEE